MSQIKMESVYATQMFIPDEELMLVSLDGVLLDLESNNFAQGRWHSITDPH